VDACLNEDPSTSVQTTTAPLRTMHAVRAQVAGDEHRRLRISVPALPVALFAPESEG
jgi:hypothetical protein